MNFIEAQQLQTQDGSNTLIHPIYGDSYHSLSGAIEESCHIYIGAGLKSILHQQNIKILEMGFGTGLNALLTACQIRHQTTRLLYHAIEAYPLGEATTAILNYGSSPQQQALYNALHAAPWGETVAITDNFSLRKIHGKIETLLLEPGYDLVYYDAFCYDSQPELWSESVFEKIYRSMNPKGILVTYSAKGVVKQALRKAGFQVERLKGAGNKHHMIRAVK